MPLYQFSAFKNHYRFKPNDFATSEQVELKKIKDSPNKGEIKLKPRSPIKQPYFKDELFGNLVFEVSEGRVIAKKVSTEPKDKLLSDESSELKNNLHIKKLKQWLQNLIDSLPKPAEGNIPSQLVIKLTWHEELALHLFVGKITAPEINHPKHERGKSVSTIQPEIEFIGTAVYAVTLDSETNKAERAIFNYQATNSQGNVELPWNSQGQLVSYKHRLIRYWQQHAFKILLSAWLAAIVMGGSALIMITAWPAVTAFVSANMTLLTASLLLVGISAFGLALGPMILGMTHKLLEWFYSAKAELREAIAFAIGGLFFAALTVLVLVIFPTSIGSLTLLGSALMVGLSGLLGGGITFFAQSWLHDSCFADDEAEIDNTKDEETLQEELGPDCFLTNCVDGVIVSCFGLFWDKKNSTSDGGSVNVVQHEANYTP